MLVCVGACLVMLSNQFIYQFTGAGDPMRMGAQVVSGIGFLGAGTIIVTKHNQIKGLTTAAGLWASAGVGLALGIGFYEAAITAAAGIYLILTVLQKWEHRVNKKTRLIEIYVELSNRIPFSDFSRRMKDMNFQIESVQFEQEGTMEVNTHAAVFIMKYPKPEEQCILADKIRETEGIEYLEIL